MSNRSSVGGKYLYRVFSSDAVKGQDERAVRYDGMILSRQRNELKRKRRLERQNKRKARKNK